MLAANPSNQFDAQHCVNPCSHKQRPSKQLPSLLIPRTKFFFFNTQTPLVPNRQPCQSVLAHATPCFPRAKPTTKHKQNPLQRRLVSNFTQTIFDGAFHTLEHCRSSKCVHACFMFSLLTQLAFRSCKVPSCHERRTCRQYSPTHSPTNSHANQSSRVPPHVFHEQSHLQSTSKAGQFPTLCKQSSTVHFTHSNVATISKRVHASCFPN